MIPNLDKPLKARLRVKAAIHGRSMEDEARDILGTALSRQPARESDLAAAIRRRFAPFGCLGEPHKPLPGYTRSTFFRKNRQPDLDTEAHPAS